MGVVEIKLINATSTTFGPFCSEKKSQSRRNDVAGSTFVNTTQITCAVT